MQYRVDGRVAPEAPLNFFFFKRKIGSGLLSPAFIIVRINTYMKNIWVAWMDRCFFSWSQEDDGGWTRVDGVRWLVGQSWPDLLLPATTRIFFVKRTERFFFFKKIIHERDGGWSRRSYPTCPFPIKKNIWFKLYNFCNLFFIPIFYFIDHRHGS